MVILQDLQVTESDLEEPLQDSGLVRSLDILDDSDDPNDSDGGIDLDLDDELGSLLNYASMLNYHRTRRKDVRRGVRSVSGFSFDVGRNI